MSTDSKSPSVADVTGVKGPEEPAEITSTVTILETGEIITVYTCLSKVALKPHAAPPNSVLPPQ